LNVGQLIYCHCINFYQFFIITSEYKQTWTFYLFNEQVAFFVNRNLFVSRISKIDVPLFSLSIYFDFTTILLWLGSFRSVNIRLLLGLSISALIDYELNPLCMVFVILLIFRAWNGHFCSIVDTSSFRYVALRYSDFLEYLTVSK
jgi:hypothetical protein